VLYGHSYNQLSVSSNGVLSSGTNIAPSNNGCLPDGGYYYQDAIFAHWDDLRTDSGAGCSSYPTGCGIFTSVNGPVDDRAFVIEWRAVYANNPAQRANFEVRLHDSGYFEIFYNLVDQGGSGSTVGTQESY